jgi:hypothetical protein
MTYISVQIDIDDVISDLSNRERQELVDKLYEDGYTTSYVDIPAIQPQPSLNDFDSNVLKIVGNEWKLSQEDVDIILNISNKLI